MPYVSYSQLFDKDQINNTPFNTTTIKTDVVNGVLYSHVFFNSVSIINNDGIALDNQKSTRIYCRVARRLEDINPPIIVIYDEFWSDVESRDITKYLRLGYCVVQFDYLGASDKSKNFTIYSLARQHCNYYKNTEKVFDFSDVITNSCWYEWGLIGLRVVAFVSSLSSVDITQITVLGIGVGGWLAIKAVVCHQDDNNIVGLILKHTFELPCFYKEDCNLEYKTKLGSSNHLAMIKVPTLVQLATNETDGSFDNTVDLVLKIPRTTILRLCISPSKNHFVGIEQDINEDLWLQKSKNQQLLDNLPLAPTLKHDSTNIKQFLISAPQAMSVLLFVCLEDPVAFVDPAFRYWQTVDAQELANGEYLAQFDLRSNYNYICFAQVKYSEGFCFCTTIHKVKATIVDNEWKFINRLIYDGNMGLDSWTVVSQQAINKGDIRLEKGAYDIEGVSGLGCELVCFKIGSSAYKGTESGVLQVTVSSSLKQELTFSVVTSDGQSDGHNEFVCYKSITAEPPWAKILLSASDFKSNGKLKLDWSRAISLRINSELPIILSNLLWL